MTDIISDLSDCRETLVRIAVDLAHPSHDHHSDQLPEIVDRDLVHSDFNHSQLLVEEML